MISKLTRFISRIAQPKVMIPLGILYLLFQMVLLPHLAENIVKVSGDKLILDLLPFYTPDEAFQKLNLLGEQGRHIYLMTEWTADLFFPIIYGLFFSGLLFSLKGGNWSVLALFSTCFDYLENIFVSILLVRFPTSDWGIAQMAAIFTSTKWMCAFSTIMMIIVLLFRNLLGWIQRRNK